MPDPRFHLRNGPFTLGELAVIGKATLAPGSDGGRSFSDVQPLDKAGPDDVSFLDNRKYKDAFSASKAGLCVVREEMAELAPDGMALLLSKHPYKSYALIAQAFYPETRATGRISKAAHISDDAIIGEDTDIAAGAVIESGARIGKGCKIHSNAVIGHNVVVGDHTVIGACATVSHAEIGSHVRIYPGARIGQDGFGFAIDPTGHVKVPQLGRVIIEDHVEIGANSCIDRGAGPDTVIGRGTWIDNLVQIGHNAKTGRGCVIVGQAGISGSTELGDFVVLAGQSGVAGHLKIGMGAKIGAQSGVMRDVPAGTDMMGSPAVPAKQFMRQVAIVQHLASKKKEES